MKRLLICWVNRRIKPCATCEEMAAEMLRSGEALTFDAKAADDWIDRHLLAHTYRVFELTSDHIGFWLWPLCDSQKPARAWPGGKTLHADLKEWHEWAAADEERRQALDEVLLIAALNEGAVP